MKENGRKRRVEPDNAGAGIRRRGQGSRPAGITALARWPGLPALQEPQGKGHLQAATQGRQQNQVRKGLYKCGACRKQFTVRVGTIFEDSHLPISKWLMAIFIICSSKKSISANQLSRMLKITYKAAWFMAHRIRFAVGHEMPLIALLKGVVEVDETFVGGKGDDRSKFARQTPVMALIEHDGQMGTRVSAM